MAVFQLKLADDTYGFKHSSKPVNAVPECPTKTLEPLRHPVKSFVPLQCPALELLHFFRVVTIGRAEKVRVTLVTAIGNSPRI